MVVRRAGEVWRRVVRVARLTGMMVVSGAPCLLWGAAPSVEALYPAGGVPGEETALELVGEKEAGPLELWTEDPGFAWVPGTEAGRGTLKIGEGTRCGAHWLRFFNGEGASRPLLFVVSKVPVVREEEPNDEQGEARFVESLPVVLDGRLSERADVDVFRLRLGGGQRLRVEVESYQLGAPVDPLVHLRDESGNLLAWNHDGYDSLDPVLEYDVGADGEYVLMLSGFAYPPQANSQFGGSADSVYRMYLSSPPIPAGSDGDEEETAVLVPGEVRGVIGEPGEVDRYGIEAENLRGQRLEMRVLTQGLGSPLDGWLEVAAPGSAEILASNDDLEGADPGLVWEMPKEGAYEVRVRDLRGFGGENFRYVIDVKEARPAVEVTASGSTGVLQGGEPLEIGLALDRRHGHGRPVTVTIEGAPIGVEVQAVTMPGDAKEGQLRLERREEAVAGTYALAMVACDGECKERVMHVVEEGTTDKGDLLENRVAIFLLTLPAKSP